MARTARLVIPGMAHHVLHRCCPGREAFSAERHYESYVDLVSKRFREEGVTILAYCLMPDHVHYLLQPSTAAGLAKSTGETHRCYANVYNAREGRHGDLWAGRFCSCPVSTRWLLPVANFIELNPTRSGLCKDPRDWPWSSAEPHVNGEDDLLVTVEPLRALTADWSLLLRETLPASEIEEIRSHTKSGRPLGKLAAQDPTVVTTQSE